MPGRSELACAGIARLLAGAAHGLPVDQRSDLFSLATICYELLSGQLPARVYIPITQRNPALPGALDPVLRRGLARDPDERYPVVELFRGDLVEALRSA